MEYTRSLKRAIRGTSYFVPGMLALDLYRNARERGLSVKNSLKIGLSWEILRGAAAISTYTLDHHVMAGFLYTLGTVDAYAFQGLYDSWLEPNNEEVKRYWELKRYEACQR